MHIERMELWGPRPDTLLLDGSDALVLRPAKYTGRAPWPKSPYASRDLVVGVADAIFYHHDQPIGHARWAPENVEDVSSKVLYCPQAWQEPFAQFVKGAEAVLRHAAIGANPWDVQCFNAFAHDLHYLFPHIRDGSLCRYEQLPNIHDVRGLPDDISGKLRWAA